MAINSDLYEFIEMPIFCGPTVRRDITKGICSMYFDVTFLESPQTNSLPIFAIIFQNSYTAMISISYSASNSNSTILENKVLMRSPFYESEANSWHIIYASEFNDGSIEKKTLRVRLFQSSGAWNSFEIRNIKVVGAIKKYTALEQSSSEVNKVSNLIKQDIKLVLN